MAGNPFDAFDTVPAAPAPAGYPGVIRGRDKTPTPASPQELERLEMERERLRLSQQGEVRQAAKDAEGTESERTAGFLAGRITDAITRLSPIAQKNPEAQSPELGAEIARGFPLIGGDKAANYVSSAARQSVRAAQLDILDAALTLGTGAAYNKEQLQGYAESYLPQLGDAAETIKSKRQALRTLLQRAAQKAGKAAPDIENAIKAFDAIPDRAPGDEAQAPDRSTPGTIERDGGLYDDKGNYLGLAGTVTDDSEPPPSDGGNSPNGGMTVADLVAGKHGPSGPDGDPRFARDPSSLSGLAALAKQGISLGLSDEAAGIGGFLSSAITGEDPTKAYIRERDTERNFISKARSEWPVMGTAAEFLGGGAAAKVSQVPGALGSVARQGAGIGALGGYGYGEGAMGSTLGAGVGAAGGAAVGSALSAVGSRLAGRSAALAPDMAVVEAGQRQNIPVRQFDARPELRNKTSAVETSEHGGPLIREARTADQAAIEGRVSEIGGTGSVADPYALGGKVQDAGKSYIARTKQQASRLYKTAEQEAGSAAVQPKEAVAAIDQNIAELKAAGENSNKGQIAYLEGLREDLSKPLTVTAVQNLRTNMRGQLAERGLTGTDAERRVGQVIDAANMDLTRDLPQSASAALKAADSFYKDRQTFINGTLKEFMGSRGAPLDAETAGKRLVSMAQSGGKFDKFSSMWKQLEPADQADAAATIAASLGRKGNGEFSASTLVRSLDPAKGINPRTARLVFGDDGAKALQDLSVLAKAKTDTQAALNNSRTGATVSKAANGLKTLMMGALGFGAGGPGGAALGAVSRGFISKWGEERAARMLLNPDFTKWLRAAPNSANPKVIDQYFSRLAGVGSIAVNDNQAFVSALRSAFSRSPGAAAADESGDSGREPPQR